MKIELINSVLEEADMNNINSENKETRNSHIKKDNSDLKNLKDAIISIIKFFKREIDQGKLLNIKTRFRRTQEA